jgi:hypothetical protein
MLKKNFSCKKAPFLREIGIGLGLIEGIGIGSKIGGKDWDWIGIDFFGIGIDWD